MASTTIRSLTDSMQAHLSLELTTRCNCDCRHCFARAGLREEATLSPAFAETICEEGYDIGYRRLHLTGGEPLLWPNLGDLLEKVFTLGYHSVFLNTNGLLLDRATASRLARYKGLSLSVSLEESPEWHDALRGAGTYRRAAEGIACALTAGVPLRIFTVIGKTLLTRLSAFVDAVAQKFPGIESLTLIEITGDAAELGDLSRELMAPDDFVRMVRTIATLNLCGFITEVLNDPLANVAADLMQLPYVPPSGALCRPGKLVVRADRRMTLAHSTRESFGTYAAGALANVLTGRDYRKAVGPDDVTCPTCRYRLLCRKHGMRQPSSGLVDREHALPFCQCVLGGIDTSVEGRNQDKHAAPHPVGRRRKP